MVSPMQVRRLSPSRRLRRDAPFTEDSRLSGMVLRMIALNSLGAFAQEISRRPAAEAVRGIAPGAGASVGAAAGGAQAGGSSASQRALDAVPPQPTRPMPPGSLLDIRI